ncbi:hypothetical protein F511_42997 [Dorcoceras hygrometricum]|uniref:Uncharacterized protein n=1 Tax=Dorcoceras hygrometricum TaxID=472368 RepID=A0A2Z7BM74_9LAMI|nr:hypothetical protein F511_42997 [Dorcoceras hygrometricum]
MEPELFVKPACRAAGNSDQLAELLVQLDADMVSQLRDEGSREYWWIYDLLAEEQIYLQRTGECHYKGYSNHRKPRRYHYEGTYLLRSQAVKAREVYDKTEIHEPRRDIKNMRVERHQTRTRFILPPKNDVDDIWRVVQHKKFPKPLTRTHKRGILRERAATRRKITGKTVNKSKFSRKDTEYKDSEDDDDLIHQDDI